jgi:5-methylcytosine-specific restriction endonuclease McrA
MKKEQVVNTLVEAAKIAIPVGIVITGSLFSFSSGSRHKILERDNYRCRVCGSTEHLEAAHYNHNKSRPDYNSPKNGRTLCTYCHLQDHIRNAGHNGLPYKGNIWAIEKLKEKLRSY